MDQPLEFKFSVQTTDATVPLAFCVRIDDNVIYQLDHVVDCQEVTCLMPDIEGPHQLVFELRGKLPEHTTIDSDGNIVKDAVLEIRDVSFDGIEIDQLLSDRAVYHHNFNGSGVQSQHRFYGVMGCNGQVCFEFECPIYIWLLENM